jgi:hypothetical protein
MCFGLTSFHRRPPLQDVLTSTCCLSCCPSWKKRYRTSFCNNVVSHQIRIDIFVQLSDHLPQCWIDCAGTNDMPLMFWPPRSPNLTSCTIFFWGCVKGKVFVPPLPQNLQQLRQWKMDAANSLDQDMLTWVWQELDYRIVCCVTGGTYMEHL